MTSTLLRSAAASAGAVLLLTLTACGGGDGGSGDSGSSSDEIPKGPLDELFEEVYGGEDEERNNRQMMDVEEATAACMAEQGFEYTPVDWSQSGGGGSMEEPEEEWGTLEFAKKWGYGASTDPWGGGEEVTSEEQFVDPNQERIESMSESEAAAYTEALYGPQTPEIMESEEYNWEDYGCSGKAQHEVYEVQTGMDEDAFQALNDEMSTMWESIQDDPRMAELDEKWASCMADAGYDGFATPMDAENSIYDQTSKVYDEAYGENGLGEDATPEDWEAVEGQVKELLAEITDEEIATATADYTCRDEVAYQRTQAEISIEFQQEFYDAHEAELEAWRATAAEQG